MSCRFSLSAHSILFANDAKLEDASKATAPSETKHLVALPETEWKLWRWAALRSAGFPARGVLKLAASPEVIAAADAVIKAESSVQLSQKKACEEINAALDKLKESGQWSDKSTRRKLFKARKKIRAGIAIQGWNPELWASRRDLESVRSTYQSLFSEFQSKSTESIREIARSADFCEALVWQNPTALHNVLGPLLAQSSNGSSGGFAQRQRMELVASYWQRYCTKNDTIGFFGPVGWAQFAHNIECFSARPGTNLIATRKIYWESWAIEALSNVIAEKEGIRPWIAPILMPFLRLEGTILHHPQFGSFQLSEKDAVLLQSCAGEDTTHEIARRLLARPELHFQTESEVYAALQEWVNKGHVFWKFNIPQCAYPEKILRKAVQRIEQEDLRESALAILDEADSAKERLEELVGKPDHFTLAYQNLERIFTQRTGLPPTRHKGISYAGRTLVYQDCRRDIEVLLGPELLQSLAGPLSLLLTAARWFTWHMAEVYKARLLQVHSQLVRFTGKSTIDAAAFFGMAAPLFFEKSTALMEPVREEFRNKWERILQLTPGTGPVTYSSRELQNSVMREFPADRPGWSRARYHSPDIMIAAPSEEAIRRGDYFFVLGELHVGINTLSPSLWVNQHPSPMDLMNAIERDLGACDIVPLWTNAEILGSRTAFSLIPNSNYQLEYLGDSFSVDRARALPVSSLVVINENGELIARSRDNKLCRKVIDVVGRLVSAGTADCFRIITQRRHVPRVSIDRMVIKRESWRLPASELSFAHCSDSAGRFLQARMWMRDQGIPRFVFLTVPMERQPWYIDFESSVLVDIFCKMIRRAMNEVSPDATISLSEMLPLAEQVWLADAKDQRYTSEFRFVAVDAAGTQN